MEPGDTPSSIAQKCIPSRNLWQTNHYRQHTHRWAWLQSTPSPYSNGSSHLSPSPNVVHLSPTTTAQERSPQCILLSIHWLPSFMSLSQEHHQHQPRCTIGIKLLSKPNKARADNLIKSRPTDPYIAHLCQLSSSLSQLRREWILKSPRNQRARD